MKIRQTRAAFKAHLYNCQRCHGYTSDYRESLCTKGRNLWLSYANSCLAAGKRGLI